jgi:hypothetical protein
LQRATEQAASAAQRASAAEARALRYEIAAKHGLDPNLIGAGDEAAMEEQATRISDAIKAAGGGGRATPPARPVESLQTGTGSAPSGAVTQLSRADLRGMSPEAIDAARVAGRLDDLLTGKA